MSRNIIFQESTLPQLSGNRQRQDKRYFDRLVKDSKLSLLAILSKIPDLTKIKTAADIGAGYGTFAINLALREIKTTAVEPTKRERDVITILSKKYPEAGKFLRIIDGKAEKLPFADNSIDLCLLSQVLEHVDSCKKTIRDVSRVLKPGGYLYLGSPNYLFPMEQHYQLPYLPLMSKKLLSNWALFYLKLIKKQQIDNASKNEVLAFVKSLNYTTDQMVNHLFKKNDLKIIWSASEHSKDLAGQIKQQWKQDQNFTNIPFIMISLPLKIIRCILAMTGILPRKLEYIAVKVK